jgi:hypothetical protein
MILNLIIQKLGDATVFRCVGRITSDDADRFGGRFFWVAEAAHRIGRVRHGRQTRALPGAEGSIPSALTNLFMFNNASGTWERFTAAESNMNSDGQVEPNCVCSGDYVIVRGVATAPVITP